MCWHQTWRQKCISLAWYHQERPPQSRNRYVCVRLSRAAVTEYIRRNSDCPVRKSGRKYFSLPSSTVLSCVEWMTTWWWWWWWCLSGLPVPWVLCHNTKTHRHVFRNHVQRSPPYSSGDEQRRSAHHPSHRQSQSETAPWVRWCDFWHFK